MKEIPPIPQKNPPHEIYAYILARPNRMLMGVAVDTRTGKNLEAVILPTKQRVMLALGIGDENAHAHHKYRQATGKAGYTLIWTDKPEKEPALIQMSERLKRTSHAVREGIRRLKEPTTEEITQQLLTAPAEKDKEEEAKPLEGFF